MIHRLAGSAIAALAETFSPQGYNLGWNLERIAGAGITDHVHLHVVPDWAGHTTHAGRGLAALRPRPKRIRGIGDHERWLVNGDDNRVIARSQRRGGC